MSWDTIMGFGAFRAVDPTLKIITGTNPAANVEISETVPAGKLWQVLGVAYTLVTEATAGARLSVLVIDDGTTVMHKLNPFITHAASLTAHYSFYSGGGDAEGAATAAGGSAISVPLPNPLFLPAAGRIRTETAVKQALDDYSAPLLTVIEYRLV